MIVLDASAVLALLHREPGHDLVTDHLDGAVLPTPNLAEVVSKLVDAGVDVRSLRELLAAAGVTIAPLTAGDAEVAGALRSIDGGRTLSLGDRCCLATALRHPDTEVLTANRAWSGLDLPVTVRQIR